MEEDLYGYTYSPEDERKDSSDDDSQNISLRDVSLANKTKRYVFLDDHELGEGSFGMVLLARDTSTNEIVAIKKLKKSNYNQKTLLLLQNEVNMLIKLNTEMNCPGSKYVVCYKDKYEDNQFYYIVMEYIDGLEFDYNITKLLQLLTRYDKETYNNIMLQLIYKLLEGLKFINDQGIVHNDIKGDNISIRVKPYNTELNKDTGVRLCVDFLPVYIDLGLSCINSCQQTMGNVLSSDPDLLITHYMRDHKFDVWSLGITILGVLINDKNIPSFLGFDMDYHQQQQQNREYIKQEYIKHVSQLRNVQKLKTSNPILNNLIEKMLTISRSERPTAGDLLKWLDQEWYNKYKMFKSPNIFFSENPEPLYTNLIIPQPQQNIFPMFNTRTAQHPSISIKPGAPLTPSGEKIVDILLKSSGNRDPSWISSDLSSSNSEIDPAMEYYFNKNK